jgi:hypothetical protein
MNFRFSVNEAQKIISVFSSFTFKHEGKHFIIVEGGCHFRIKFHDWENFLSEDKTELIIPKGLLVHLATITVGITRGILHAKTENSNFNQYHLPIINVGEMIKKDSVFKINDEKNMRNSNCGPLKKYR